MPAPVDFKKLKRETINAAKELFYGNDVINQLHYAKTEGELSRIMQTARQRN